MRSIKKPLFILAFLYFFCSFLTPPTVHAQILDLPMERGDFEIGYMYKWFHRDMEPNLPEEMKWEVATLFARYGGFEWLTISVEGGASQFKHDDFIGLRYRRYTIGGGAAAKLYRYGPWEFSGCFHFNEVFDHDGSSNYFDKRTRSVIGGLQVGRLFVFRGQELCVWAGPMFVEDIGENYPWGTKIPIKNESENDFGFVFGGHALLLRHLDGILNVVYADYFQARLGFAFFLEGGEK